MVTDTAKQKRADRLEEREERHSLGEPEVAMRFLRRDEREERVGGLKESWRFLRGAEMETALAAGVRDTTFTSVAKKEMYVARILVEEEMAKLEGGEAAKN